MMGACMDLMTAISGIPGVGPFLPYLTALVAVMAAVAPFVPPPGADAGVVYVTVYRVVNAVALNFGHAKNATDPKS